MSAGESRGRRGGKAAAAADRALVRALSLLPARAKLRLSGGAPVRLDGQELDTDTQLLLAAMKLRGEPDAAVVGVEGLREERLRASVLIGGRPAPVASVRDLRVPGGEGEIPVRHYAPAEAGGPHPLLVYLHGGGWVFGDIATHDSLCRMLCRHGGVHVLSVDYRLSPEHRFPAAIEDSQAALRWAREHAAELGADPARVGVGGDSAGGNMAAVLSLLAREAGEPGPAIQLLIYPATGIRAQEHWRSRELFADGFFLTTEQMAWFEEQYLGAGHGLDEDIRVSPHRAGDLSGLAPALVVTAGFDPLRDEGEEYARRLAAEGTHTVLRRFPGLIHGFASMPGVSRAAHDAVIEIAGAMRAMLAAAPTQGASANGARMPGEPAAAR